MFLLELDAWTGSAVERLYFSTHTFTTRPPANTVYDGRLVDVGSVQQATGGNRSVIGPASSTTLEITLNNGDGGLDYLLDAGVSGRRLALLYNDGASTVVFRGTCQSIDSKDAQRTIRLRARDRFAEIDKPLLTARYLGTTLTYDSAAKAEGTGDLKETIKPHAWGRNTNVPGKLANAFVPLYQFAANRQSAMTPYDGGIPIPLVGDFDSAEALIMATVPAGSAATCLELGIVRYGSPPFKAATADLIEGATAAERTAGRLTARMLALFGWDSLYLNSASLAALDAFNAAEIGVYVDDDRTCLAALSEVLDSIGACTFPDSLGALQFVAIQDPASSLSVRDFTLRDGITDGQAFGLASGATEEGDGVPVWSVVLNWGRVWQQQGAGDLLGDPTLMTADPVGGLARRDFLSRAYRVVAAQDLTVVQVHLLTDSVTYNTLLVNEADAAAEASRRLGLLKVRRDRPVWPVTFEDALGIKIGDVVSIDPRDRQQRSRFGWGAGKKFRVLGIGTDFTRRITTLDLWG
jgi:hypothetical protein